MNVLLRKIEERQRLDSRPMGTLTPKLHPAEVMQVELLARPLQIKVRRPQNPYPSTKPPSWTAPASLPKVNSEDFVASPVSEPFSSPAPEEAVTFEPRPTPKIPLGVKEVLAREVFIKWGAELKDAPVSKELTKAYRKLAFKLHPDRSSHPDASAIFSDISDAYQILKAWAKSAY